MQDLQKETRDVVANVLKDSIIFMNDDLIALDKPYGLPSHGGPGVHHSVGRLLPELASLLRDQNEPLHLIHRCCEAQWCIHTCGYFSRRSKKLHFFLARMNTLANSHTGAPDKTPDQPSLDFLTG